LYPDKKQAIDIGLAVNMSAEVIGSNLGRATG
jgi:hypothetical protein